MDSERNSQTGAFQGICWTTMERGRWSSKKDKVICSRLWMGSERERKSIINIILRQIAAGSKAMPSIRFNQNMSKLFHQNSTHMCCTWGACAVIIPYRVPKLCIRTGQRWRVVFGLHRRHCSELLRPQRPRLGWDSREASWKAVSHVQPLFAAQLHTGAESVFFFRWI